MINNHCTWTKEEATEIIEDAACTVFDVTERESLYLLTQLGTDDFAFDQDVFAFSDLEQMLEDQFNCTIWSKGIQALMEPELLSGQPITFHDVLEDVLLDLTAAGKIVDSDENVWSQGSRFSGLASEVVPYDPTAHTDGKTTVTILQDLGAPRTGVAPTTPHQPRFDNSNDNNNNQPTDKPANSLPKLFEGARGVKFNDPVCIVEGSKVKLSGCIVTIDGVRVDPTTVRRLVGGDCNEAKVFDGDYVSIDAKLAENIGNQAAAKDIVRVIYRPETHVAHMYQVYDDGSESDCGHKFLPKHWDHVSLEDPDTVEGNFH